LSFHAHQRRAARSPRRSSTSSEWTSTLPK
jgi:hypothetical protein